MEEPVPIKVSKSETGLKELLISTSEQVSSWFNVTIGHEQSV